MENDRRSYQRAALFFGAITLFLIGFAIWNYFHSSTAYNHYHKLRTQGIATMAYIDDSSYVRGACSRYSCETDILYNIHFRLANGQVLLTSTRVRKTDAEKQNITSNIVVYYLPASPGDIVNDISTPDASYPIVSSIVNIIFVMFAGGLASVCAIKAKKAKV